jgi:hypothetical protein
LQAEDASDDITFTTVHTALVRTPMISPTMIYDKFPALTPDRADAVFPAVLDLLRNRAFTMFE